MRAPRVLTCVACVLIFLGCGGDGDLATSDAGDGADAPVADGATPDGEPGACTGSCADLTFALAFGGATGGFDRAYFGLTDPAGSDSGTWELHLEAYAGGDDGCPTMRSATPDQTLIVTGLSVEPTASGEADAIVTLLDFAFDYLEPGGSPVAGGDSATATWVAADPCVACTTGEQPDRDDRFVALHVSATFDEGTGAGHLYANHCGSLDVVDL